MNDKRWEFLRNKPFDPSLSVREFAAASSEAGELILVEPLRKRLQSLAPNVHVSWTPSHRDENIDSLRNARSRAIPSSIPTRPRTSIAPSLAAGTPPASQAYISRYSSATCSEIPNEVKVGTAASSG